MMSMAFLCLAIRLSSYGSGLRNPCWYFTSTVAVVAGRCFLSRVAACRRCVAVLPMLLVSCGELPLPMSWVGVSPELRIQASNLLQAMSSISHKRFRVGSFVFSLISSRQPCQPTFRQVSAIVDYRVYVHDCVGVLFYSVCPCVWLT